MRHILARDARRRYNRRYANTTLQDIQTRPKVSLHPRREGFTDPAIHRRSQPAEKKVKTLLSPSPQHEASRPAGTKPSPPPRIFTAPTPASPRFCARKTETQTGFQSPSVRAEIRYR